MSSHSVRRFISCVLISSWLVTAPLSVAASDSKTKKKKEAPPYALIFGTVWDSHDQPVYGVPVAIRRADQKKAKWHLFSDHNGEFAQRVPAGRADYVVYTEIKPKKGEKNVKPVETKVHIDNDERVDISLHLTE